MCLCGISSDFSLLSPSIRQVTHVLLTRPPLDNVSSGRSFPIRISFDLHVLGTPPAFILSQDRTLIQWRPSGLLLLRSFLSLAFFLLLLRVFFAALSVLSESLLCLSAIFCFQAETAFAVSNIQGLCMIRSLIFKVLAAPWDSLLMIASSSLFCQCFSLLFFSLFLSFSPSHL